MRKPAQKAQDLADYILSSHVDLLALEEIHDADQKNLNTGEGAKAPWTNNALDRVLKLLGDSTGDEWSYLLTDRGPANERCQLTGVLWRKSRVEFKARFSIPVEGGAHPVAGQPKEGLTYWTRQPEAFLFSAGQGKTDFVVVPLHMKSNTDPEGKDMRTIEARQLVVALPALESHWKGEKDIVLLGDSNIHAAEQEVQNLWTRFIDLNAADAITYIKPDGKHPPAPFDRIFVPKGNAEFMGAVQKIHGPYPAAGQQEVDWYRGHNKRCSDHLLIWCDVAVMDDDDK